MNRGQTDGLERERERERERETQMHAYVSNATSRSRTSRLASTAERGKQGLDVVNESEAT